MTQQIRLITYAVVIALVLLLAWIGTPKRDYNPTGLLLPTGKHFAAVPVQQVTLSTQALTNGTDVGAIHLEAYAPDKSQGPVVATEKLAAQLAANAGANHVVIQGFFKDPSDDTLHFYGKAVRN